MTNKSKENNVMSMLSGFSGENLEYSRTLRSYGTNMSYAIRQSIAFRKLKSV
jgi:hypothetical protein